METPVKMSTDFRAGARQGGRAGKRAAVLALVRRHWELLASVLLLLLPFIVYVSHAQTPWVPGPARRVVVFATTPVQRVMAGAVELAQDAWHGYADLRGVRAENEQLRRETLRLRTAQQKMAETEAENGRLRRLAAWAETQPDTRMVAAPVLGWGADTQTRSVRIGRGGGDGIRAGMAVVTPDGVVGRVSAVFDDAADVLLIIDPHSAVAARSQRTRARATARGLGDPGRMRLDYVVRTDDIEEGDLFVTAPSGGMFPRGLRIGRAARVQQSPYGLFKLAELVPAVDFDKLDEVLVVVENAPSASAEVPATAVTR